MDEKTKILSEQMEEELLNASKDAIECIMMSAYLNDFETSIGLGGVGTGVLTGIFVGLAIPTVGASIIVGAILDAIIGVSAYVMGSAMQTVYESTYANGPNPNAPAILQGDKYVWVYLKNEYIYPWTVVLDLASSIGFYGILASGSAETIWPNVPLAVFGGYAGVALSGYFSAGVQNFINSYGQNDWVWFS
jgi:hypothetical protein